MTTLGSFEKAKLYILSHSAEKDLRQPKTQIGPCITISRETGARADRISEILINIFQKLNSKANWAIFDKNLIEKVLQDHHLPETLSNLMEEKKYPGMNSILNELLAGQPGVWSLAHKTTKTIFELGQIGNVIILDRGANVITSNLSNAYHIRLVAPIDARIAHVQQLFNLDKKDALDFIKQEDADRKDYLRNYFHKDISDPLLYNIIINSGLQSDEECAEIIKTGLLNKLSNLFSFD
ncbi:MAG: cytidylate kinase-like family protein [Ignavibacteriaceae bacterium]